MNSKDEFLFLTFNKQGYLSFYPYFYFEHFDKTFSSMRTYVQSIFNKVFFRCEAI